MGNIKKIIFLFGSGDFSGASVMGLNYMLALKSKGYDVSAYIEKFMGNYDKSLLKECQKNQIIHSQVSGFVNGFSFSLILKLALEYRIQKFDLIINVNQNTLKIGGVLGLLTNSKVITLILNKRSFRGVGKKIKYYIYGQFLKFFSDKIVTCSNQLLEETCNKFRISSNKVFYIPNGINTKKLNIKIQKQDVINELFNDNKKHIVNVARLNKQKGQLVLIKAIKKIVDVDQEIKVDIIGNAENFIEREYESLLVNTINKYRLNNIITFHGWQNNYLSYMLNSTVYVHPSLWEGLSLSVLTAMYLQKVVIITDASEVPKSFDTIHQFFIAKSNNSDDLKNKILYSLSLSEKEKKLIGLRNKRIVEKYYDISNSMEKFSTLISNFSSE